jgi:hypothetical protein
MKYLIFILSIFACACQSNDLELKIRFINKTGFDIENIRVKSGTIITKLANNESSTYVTFQSLESFLEPVLDIQFAGTINGQNVIQGSSIAYPDPSPGILKIETGTYDCEVRFDVGQDRVKKVFLLKLVR